jgi:hypothetical protein
MWTRKKYDGLIHNAVDDHMYQTLQDFGSLVIYGSVEALVALELLKIIVFYSDLIQHH